MFYFYVNSNISLVRPRLGYSVTGTGPDGGEPSRDFRVQIKPFTVKNPDQTTIPQSRELLAQ